IFLDGVNSMDKLSKDQFGHAFMHITPQQRTALLVQLDKEQKAYHEKKKPEDPPHFFRMVKELTLLGFFTSEVGATRALRYVQVPGRYDGCIDYKKGDRAWAL
ncbi:MAG TPA: gluconate 2-dehydrogenase subunit 3 family protein, partial [Phnomibacter sp.]|nr:gluconate 2-dehydrogenase subunit 3 family protein [Phnomibacter sp.]